uniref:ABC-2 type transporter transmembrane domain-containing protein n=1 Tax=Timema monikensis TaxID=170555 RepID=A0A7R9EG33_9NEOP|nr:unnamed protein product [Timema monikensis]
MDPDNWSLQSGRHQTGEPATRKTGAKTTGFQAVMAGLCFTGTIKNTQLGVQSVQGALFILVSENTFSPMYSVLATFPREMPMFLREYRSGLYSTHIYYISKMIAMFPGLIVEPLVFVILTYWLAGLRDTLYAFLFTAFITIMTMNVSIACAMQQITVPMRTSIMSLQTRSFQNGQGNLEPEQLDGDIVIKMSAGEVTIVTTKKGKPSIIANGYKYRQHRLNSWVCVKKKCRGSRRVDRVRSRANSGQCLCNWVSLFVVDLGIADLWQILHQGYDFVITIPKYNNMKTCMNNPDTPCLVDGDDVLQQYSFKSSNFWPDILGICRSFCPHIHEFNQLVQVKIYLCNKAPEHQAIVDYVTVIAGCGEIRKESQDCHILGGYTLSSSERKEKMEAMPHPLHALRPATCSAVTLYAQLPDKEDAH